MNGDWSYAKAPRVEFRFGSRIAIGLKSLGIVQGVFGVIGAIVLFFAGGHGTGSTALSLAAASVSLCLTTIGFSYIVEYAARMLTRDERGE